MVPRTVNSDNARVRVGALQFEPVHGDVGANLEQARTLLLAVDGPRPALVVFPEMALTGYIWSSAAEILPHAVKCSDPATQAGWIALAKESGSWLVIGHPAVDEATGHLTNRCTLVSPTEVVGHYDKTCLFVEDLTWASAGELIPPLWDTPIGMVAPLICADLDYPEPIESAVARGAQAIVFSTAWVAEPAPSATWTLRAAEYGIPIIAADLIGTDQGVVFSGGSSIIDRDAVIVATNDYGVGLVSAEITLGPARVSVKPGAKVSEILVYRLEVLNTATTTESVTISVWSDDPVAVPPAPPNNAGTPHLIVLPTTSEPREACLARTQAYSTRHNAFVVQGLLPASRGTTEILITTPDSRFFTFTSSETTPAVVLLDVSGVLIGVMSNSDLSSNSVSRALSILGATVILGQGAHTLPAPRGSARTDAPFPSGLGDADASFGHPVRFRAGDANVWFGFCSETEAVPSGVFSPDHVAWPRNESLIVPGQWASHTCSLNPSDPWGQSATAKPLVSSRNLALYRDAFGASNAPATWTQ